jgi:hypothetical protein
MTGDKTMKLSKRSHLAALAAALMGTLSLGVWAQSGFPSQPIKIIVPFTPGTGMDTIARVVAPRLSERQINTRRLHGVDGCQHHVDGLADVQKREF